MPWYSVNTSTMIQSLRWHVPEVKQVWLADDSAGGGRVEDLNHWYKYLCEDGKKYGYLVNGSKSWLILKSQELVDEAKWVFGDEVNITTEGKRHLGAVIGSKVYRDHYCTEKVQGWKGEILTLAEIAKSQPHAAYIVFTKGYKSKFTYCMQTIESFEEYVDPVQQFIDEMYLPIPFGQAEPLPDELSKLMTLTPAQGRLGIPDLITEAPQQYSASKLFTRQHVESIKSQSEIINTNEQLVEELMRDLQSLKAENTRSKIKSINASLDPELLCLTQQAGDKGASSWLNAIPLKDQGLAVNNQEFTCDCGTIYHCRTYRLPVLVVSHLM
ncbi:uncharacterized protein LOC111340333 [Stylophora pistillata]|uniref:uncharacterized protein LOC111340333 n=1 Tax=Stylophora pistillata TaxID=50429 RepID=UPI000C0479F5|nr:uncharacterized protein LOC111340333 [Stylophora pistillata]